VNNQHIWQHGVGRIDNPTYLWRIITAIPREPKILLRGKRYDILSSSLGVPILTLPDLKEVKAFANHLHSLGKYWQGEIFGWQAEYSPESDKKPVDSKLTFTPACGSSMT
jgi:hypothetical protein